MPRTWDAWRPRFIDPFGRAAIDFAAVHAYVRLGRQQASVHAFSPGHLVPWQLVHRSRETGFQTTIGKFLEAEDEELAHDRFDKRYVGAERSDFIREGLAALPIAFR